MVTVAAIPSSASLLHNLAEARARTDELFAIVRPEALYDRPISQRHRIIFYIGHLETFDWNLLGRRFFGLAPFAPGFDKLFAFGIDPLEGGPADQPRDWPSIEEIARYKSNTREALDNRLAASEQPSTESGAESAARRGELAQLLHVAIEHRLMHAETLAYMLHQLPIHRKVRPARHHGQGGSAATGTAQTVMPRMIEIPQGIATLGLARSEDGPFGWDNEFEAHSVAVPAFAMDEYPVTHRQFLQFVAAGGYQQRSLWSDADWKWLRESGTMHPIFWLQRGGQWFYRNMFDEVPLPPDWPVFVSHAEAEAYTRWAGKELPSESEWHRAAYGTPQGSERAYPWGEEPPDASRGNFDFLRWEPTPVGTFPAGRSAFGLADLAGNGWEWTRTPFAPFEGFEAFSFYPGYSADFFDGKHYVMKGGIATDSGVYAAAIVSQLVPAALSLRVCRLPLCPALISPEEHSC